MDAIHLPMSERLLDRLSDILFASDEILGMIDAQRRPLDSSSQSVKTAVSRVYHDVNELMKQLVD